MAMTRAERIALHKKQERLQVKPGKPEIAELIEGVPVLRSTVKGVVEYVRYKNVLYEKVLDASKAVEAKPDGVVSADKLHKTWDEV